MVVTFLRGWAKTLAVVQKRRWEIISWVLTSAFFTKFPPGKNTCPVHQYWTVHASNHRSLFWKFFVRRIECYPFENRCTPTLIVAFTLSCVFQPIFCTWHRDRCRSTMLQPNYAASLAFVVCMLSDFCAFEHPLNSVSFAAVAAPMTITPCENFSGVYSGVRVVQTNTSLSSTPLPGTPYYQYGTGTGTTSNGNTYVSFTFAATNNTVWKGQFVGGCASIVLSMDKHTYQEWLQDDEKGPTNWTGDEFAFLIHCFFRFAHFCRWGDYQRLHKGAVFSVCVVYILGITSTMNCFYSPGPAVPPPEWTENLVL